MDKNSFFDLSNKLNNLTLIDTNTIPTLNITPSNSWIVLKYISNENVDNNAAIDISKLYWSSFNKILVSDSSGNIITWIDEWYLSGLTSNIQTQLNWLTADALTVIKMDGSRAFTNTINAGNNRMINLLEPIVWNNAATKNYVDTHLQWVDDITISYD